MYTGGPAGTRINLKQFVISQRYDTGFFIGLMAKDIRTAQHLAERLGAPLPLGDTADHTAINRFLTEAS